jgi:hypothetical protein
MICFLFLKNVFKLWFKFYYESYFYLPNIKVYHTLIDELVLNHHLKWYFNHFDKFYKKVLNFPRFSMHECNAHIGVLLIYF